MKFEEPQINKLTVYSKSECKNCDKIKNILTKAGFEYHVVNCDAYLLVHRELFLDFIKDKSHGQSVKTFPMVFNPDAKYIGGYAETMEYIERVIMQNECDDF